MLLIVSPLRLLWFLEVLAVLVDGLVFVVVVVDVQAIVGDVRVDVLVAEVVVVSASEA